MKSLTIFTTGKGRLMIVAVIIAMVFALSYTPVSAATYSTGDYTITTTAGLNLRQTASTSATILTAIPYNKTVSVTQINGNWGKTTYNSKTGWISLEYAKKVVKYSTGNYTITASAGLNLRQSASTSATILTAIPYNKTVSVTQISGAWGKTTYNSKTGWISLEYAKFVTGSAAASAASTAVAATSNTKFTPRKTAPDSKNKYYYSDINLYYKSGWGMPNCTAYAWGRAYEILGGKPKLSTGDGRDFYPNKSDGYKRGSTPKLGAIACWAGASDSAGHVAVVEEINGSKVTISESHYYSKVVFDTYSLTIGKESNYVSNFQGYIYILP